MHGFFLKNSDAEGEFPDFIMLQYEQETSALGKKQTWTNWAFLTKNKSFCQKKHNFFFNECAKKRNEYFILKNL